MVLLILCVFIATLPIWSQYSWFPQHWFHQPNQDNCTIVELRNGNSTFFCFCQSCSRFAGSINPRRYDRL